MRINPWRDFGLVILIGGLIACGSGGADKAGSGGNTGDNSQDDKPAAAAGIGKPARDGKFEFVVTKMDCTKTTVGKEPLVQKAQGKWCLVSLTVQNIGTEAQLFDASSQKALDAKSTTYDADGGAAIYVNKNAETFLNNINPGNKIQGVLPFDVPTKTTITQLELHDSAFSDGVKVTVK